MLSLTLLEILAAAACALATGQASAIDVQLVHVNDTVITAVVTNTGATAYNLLHRNSILDPEPTRKLRIATQGTVDIPFHGIMKHDCAHHGPSSDAFTPIAAGQSLYRDVDIAELFDLDTAVYELYAGGAIPYAAEGSLQLLDQSLPMTSNVLSLSVNAEQAKTVEKALDKRRTKRTTIEVDCSAEQKEAIRNANQNCASLANAAADAASSGSAEMLQQYFRDTSDSTRSEVANVYRAVADECSRTPGGTSTSHCTDPSNYCSGDLLAYTIWRGSGPSQIGTTYYCPRYFSVLSPKSARCHEQSQATNTLHEMTHAVWGTNDAAYGFDAISRLSSAEAVQNADTYALFATDLDLNCGGAGQGGEGSSASSTGGGASAPSAGGGSSGGQMSWRDWLNSQGWSWSAKL